MKSSTLFKNKIFPIIKTIIKGPCEYFQIEGQENNRLNLLMDRYSGIDGFLAFNHQMVGVASRVQTCISGSYNSFTIRLSRRSGRETELEKRLAELQEPGILSPILTIQSYLDPNDNPLAIGIIETKLLYNLIQSELPKVKNNKSYLVQMKTNPVDGNIFLISKWERLKMKTSKIKIWHDPQHLTI